MTLKALLFGGLERGSSCYLLSNIHYGSISTCSFIEHLIAIAGAAECGFNWNCPRSALSDITNIRIINTTVRMYLNSESYSKSWRMLRDNPYFYGLFLIHRKQTVLLLIQKCLQPWTERIIEYIYFHLCIQYKHYIDNR